MPRTIFDFFGLTIEEQETYLIALTQQVRKEIQATEKIDFVPEESILPKLLIELRAAWTLPEGLDDLNRIQDELRGLEALIYSRNKTERAEIFDKSTGASSSQRFQRTRRSMELNSAMSGLTGMVNGALEILEMITDCKKCRLDFEDNPRLKGLQEILESKEISVDEKLNLIPVDRSVESIIEFIQDRLDRPGIDATIKKTKMDELDAILDSVDSNLLKLIKLEEIVDSQFGFSSASQPINPNFIQEITNKLSIVKAQYDCEDGLTELRAITPIDEAMVKQIELVQSKLSSPEVSLVDKMVVIDCIGDEKIKELSKNLHEVIKYIKSNVTDFDQSEKLGYLEPISKILGGRDSNLLILIKIEPLLKEEGMAFLKKDPLGVRIDNFFRSLWSKLTGTQIELPSEVFQRRLNQIKEARAVLNDAKVDTAVEHEKVGIKCN